MPFNGVLPLAAAVADTGASWISFFHKTGGPASFGAGRWGDMSMGAGIPKYNAYVGSQATATPLIGAGNDGIYCGPSVLPDQTKHLHDISLQSTSTTLAPAHFVLCDYVMCYPLIDGDSTDQQDMDNTLTLPRYPSGAGVQCMVVCTTPMVANAITTITYTNQAGVTGRTSTFQLLASTVVGCIVSSSNTSGAAGSASPFIPLANGDTGIRSIQSITNATGAGGFFALALVRPLATVQLLENNTQAEITQLTQRADLPQVLDGAYLNWIYQPAQSGTATLLRGHLTFAWS